MSGRLVRLELRSRGIAPAVIVRVPIEGAPVAHVVAVSFEDQAALRGDLLRRPDLLGEIAVAVDRLLITLDDDEEGWAA